MDVKAKPLGQFFLFHLISEKWQILWQKKIYTEKPHLRKGFFFENHRI
jgi:hypothetical protein